MKILFYAIGVLTFYGFYKAFNTLFLRFRSWRKEKGYSDFWEMLLGTILIFLLGIMIYAIIEVANKY